MSKTFWEMTHEERSELAKNDPQAFEKLYMAELDEEGQKQLWPIQKRLSLVKNPHVRMEKAYTMMIEQVKKLHQALEVFKK